MSTYFSFVVLQIDLYLILLGFNKKTAMILRVKMK